MTGTARWILAAAASTPSRTDFVEVSWIATAAMCAVPFLPLARCSDMKTSARSGNDTVAQLKQDIHAARAGDGVAVHDLGLSPFGTDDEAAGHSPSPEEISLARRQAASTSDAALRADPSSGVAKKVWPLLAMMALIGVILLVVMAKVIGGI